MLDDTQSEIQNILQLLAIEKQSLAMLMEQASRQGSLYQISPNFNEIVNRKENIRQLQADLARLTIVPLIADLNRATLYQYYCEAFGAIPPHGTLAHATTVSDIVDRLFKDVDRSSEVATAFFKRILQEYPRLTPILEPILVQNRQYLDLRWETSHSVVHNATRCDDLIFQIALDPHPLYHDQFRVRAWLLGTTRATELLTEDEIYKSSLNELKKRILELYELVTARYDVDVAHLTIDVFLPTSMLSAGIHLWLIEEYEGITSELGYAHPVHIRFYERSFKGDSKTKKARDRWKEKWRTMIHAPRTTIYRLTTAQELMDVPLLYRILSQKMCYVECCGQHRYYDARIAVMIAGIGIGLWLSDDATDACSDFTALHDFVRAALPLDHHFPTVMFDKRRDEPWAKPLVVLWDDPDRRPYDVDNPNDPNTPHLAYLA